MCGVIAKWPILGMSADDEIRQKEGFKNVHLQNVILANYAAAKVNFLTEQDSELLKK